MYKWKSSLNLSPYATVTYSRQNDEEDCDIRNPFQRDRDRIIHSKSFRRLINKTQVFISPQDDHYRTRLTHTLEVSQISRTIARALELNEDLTEAIAMGHDLGHTPFGHSGEDALKKVSTIKFRHNEQSLRTVDIIERDGLGLNLTNEVRDGILCHTGDTLPKTLEGKIVRIADRIAYINHDIDDAIRAGILSQSDIPADILSVLGESHKARIDTLIRSMITYSTGKNDIGMDEYILDNMNRLRKFMFENVYLNKNGEDERAIHITKSLYKYYLANMDKVPIRNYNENDSVDRRICDYIASMTDRFAEREYSKLLKEDC